MKKKKQKLRNRAKDALELPPVQRLALARSQPHFDRAQKSPRAF
jgi:hypothetical protein